MGMELLNDKELLLSGRYIIVWWMSANVRGVLTQQLCVARWRGKELMRFDPETVVSSVFVPGGFPYDVDAYHVKEAPNGLLYVSDFTGFTSTVVLTKVQSL